MQSVFLPAATSHCDDFLLLGHIIIPINPLTSVFNAAFTIFVIPKIEWA
jgi:hypothetical protein